MKGHTNVIKKPSILSDEKFSVRPEGVGTTRLEGLYERYRNEGSHERVRQRRVRTWLFHYLKAMQAKLKTNPQYVSMTH